MWVKDEISLRINLIKNDKEKNKNENDDKNIIITNSFNSSDLSALKRLIKDFNLKLNYYLSYLTITARKIKLSFFNKR